jgi:predicted DNA-binding protein (UPF0251 family)
MNNDKRKGPTGQQLTAYRLVYMVGLTQQQAASCMACTQANISQLLKNLKKVKPQLFNARGRTALKTLGTRRGEITF